jgi:hypothetical protein
MLSVPPFLPMAVFGRFSAKSHAPGRDIASAPFSVTDGVNGFGVLGGASDWFRWE